MPSRSNAASESFLFHHRAPNFSQAAQKVATLRVDEADRVGERALRGGDEGAPPYGPDGITRASGSTQSAARAPPRPVHRVRSLSDEHWRGAQCALFNDILN